MSHEAEFRYRMSEAKRRVRNGTRTGSGNSEKARDRMASSLLLISGFVAAGIALYLYSLS